MKPKLSKVDFDHVAPLRPVDLTAGRVASAGAHWDPKIVLPPGYMHWDAPPPMKPFVDNRNNESDLTGKQIGRFKVLGLLDGKKGEARWVVRCVCGDYEVRRSIALKVALNVGEFASGSDCCIVCQHHDKIKRVYAVEGSRPISQFVDGKLIDDRPKRATRPLLDVIAGWIPDTDRARIAKRIVADLQKNGYRIIREGKY